MPRGGRVKIKTVKQTLNNKDVLDMFHDVLGTGENASLRIDIVHGKMQKMAEHLARYLKVLDVFWGARLMAERFPDQALALQQYARSLRADFEANFAAPDLAPYIVPTGTLEEQVMQDPRELYARVPADVKDAYLSVYAKAKDCRVGTVAVVTCKNLVPHKKALRAMEDGFLLRAGGQVFAPLAEHPLNVRRLYIDTRLTKDDRRLLLSLLAKLLAVTHDVYRAVSAPDMDVDEFVEVIMSSIDQVKKHIPRCDAAFDKIAESISMLRHNFGDYYRDYVASNNPSIIMENFVVDVAKTTTASPDLTRQFREIIAHYRKQAAQQSHNPKLQTLFAKVDENFSELERQTRLADETGEAAADADADADASSDTDTGASSGDAAGPSAASGPGLFDLIGALAEAAGDDAAGDDAATDPADDAAAE